MSEKVSQACINFEKQCFSNFYFLGLSSANPEMPEMDLLTSPDETEAVIFSPVDFSVDPIWGR